MHTPLDTASTQPTINKVRHDLKWRSLTVERTERITPAMLRVFLSGDDLADFISLAPDDHIKIVVAGGSTTPERHDYTPRRFDRNARTLGRASSRTKSITR